jgi:hypothetical protein
MRSKLYCIEAISKLGRRVRSGPWSSLWIRRKALSYETGGFTNIAIIDMSAKQAFSLDQFLSQRSTRDDEPGVWQLDA